MRKIGIAMIMAGGIIILGLLYALAFVSPDKEELPTNTLPKGFNGPTSPPHVEGPTEPPPTDN